MKDPNKRPTKKYLRRENLKHPYKNRRDIMKRKQPNHWKAATIVLGLLVLGLIIYSFLAERQLEEEKGKIIDINGLKIYEKDLEKFMNVTGEDQSIKICDIEKEICRVVSWKKPQ